VRRFIQIVLILLLLVAGIGGWYLYRKGLTKPWRELVIEELRKRGVEMSFGTLAVEPFRGLVARDVRVFDSPKKQRMIARVDEMVVEANYANAARGKPFLDAITLVDAALDLPLDSKNPAGPAVTVEKLNTRIVLPEDRLVISRLDAVLFGIRVTASGQLVHPDAIKSEPSKPGDGAENRAVVSRALNELRALKFPDHPRLDIRFGGDLAEPSSLVVEASLSTGRIQRGRYQLEGLDVALSWRNEALLLHRFEARDVVGRLHLGGSYRPETRELDARFRSGMDLATLLGASGVWDSGDLRFESAPQIDAVMKAKFEKPGVPRAKRDGDDRIDLSGRLKLGRFAFGKVAFDDLAADFAWDGKRWAVRDLVLAHRGGGSVRGDAMQDYDALGNGDFRLSITSTINPESLAPFFEGEKPWQREASAQLARFKFPDAPQIVLTARGSEPSVDNLDASGRVKFGRFVAGDIPFEQMGADFEVQGKRWAVRNLVLRHRGSGEIKADVSQDFDAAGRGDFRLALSSTLNPEALAPFFQGNEPWQRKAAARLALFKFPDAPKITLNARGSAPSLDALSASGDLKLGRCSYRGAAARSVNANLRFSANTLHVDNLFVQRAEGVGGGSLKCDFGKDLVFVQNVRMGLFPQDVALWIDPELVEDIRPYRFTKFPPNLRIDGVVDRRKGGRNTKLEVKLDAERGMDYTFVGKELKFEKVDARMVFDDERMKLTDVRAVLFDGLVKGSADISIMKAKPGHAAEVRFIDVNFEKLTKLYFDYNDSKGKLNGVYNFNGKGDQAKLMEGEGKLEITDGYVFAIPFLGPFSDVLNKIVPGMGYNRARRAGLTFAIDDGIITTRNLEIEGRGFSMFGQGKIWFMDDRMDFDMRLNAQGLPGVLLLPVSELLEYRSDAKFSQPNWRLKVIPRLKTPEKPAGKPQG
jgi:hypothetical protein